MPGDASDSCPDQTEGAWYSYAVLRLAPHIERGEVLNVGIILYARTLSYLEARYELNAARIRAFAPDLDLEAVAAHLAVLRDVASGNPAGGPIAALSQSERFHWLSSPRSTVIQPSDVHVGTCTDAAAQMARLMDTLVR